MTRPKIRNILVPTDFSSSADAALTRAKALAAATGAEVTLLYVVEPTPADGAYDMRQSYGSRAGEVAPSDIGPEVAAALHSVGRTRLVLRRGDPGEAIVGYARTTDVDLIMIGAHGGKAAFPRRIGSVAMHVLHHAPVPVQLVRGPSRSASGERVSRVPARSSREEVFRGLDGNGRVEFGVLHRSRLEELPHDTAP